jgi:hypothetical protein
MTDPKKWRDMTPEEKGALLLAHHEGKAIQLWCHEAWEACGAWEACSSNPGWAGHCAYRVKPPEPRVWWIVFTRYGDVYTTCGTKEAAEGWVARDKTRAAIRVVECPDD